MRHAVGVLAVSDQRSLNSAAFAYGAAFGIPAVAFLAYSCIPAHGALLGADGPEYMYFALSRPVGYPLFLSLVRMIFGTLTVIPHVQLSIYCAAAALLGISFFLLSGSLVLTTILELAVVSYPGPAQQSQHIGSDSLSSSLLILYAATLILVARSKQMWAFVGLVAVAVLAITIRPVNIALVPSLLLVIATFGELLPATRWAQAGIVIAGLVGGLGITPAVHTLVHGSATAASPLARDLFEKVMFIPSPADGQRTECDRDFIDPILAPVNRYLATAPAALRPLLELRYSDQLRFNVILPGLVKRHGYVSFTQADRILMCYAISRFIESPAPVLTQILREYWKLLTNWTYLTQRQRSDFQSFIETYPPVLPVSIEHPAEEYDMRRRAIAELGASVGNAGGVEKTEVAFDPPAARPQALTLALDTFQVGAVGISIIGILAIVLNACGWPHVDRTWLIIGLLGIAVQGTMIITATAEIALPRYMFPLWAPLCTIIMLWVGYVSGLTRLSRSARSAASQAEHAAR
jgi:hypothetical protein